MLEGRTVKWTCSEMAANNKLINVIQYIHTDHKYLLKYPIIIYDCSHGPLSLTPNCLKNMMGSVLIISNLSDDQSASVKEAIICGKHWKCTIFLLQLGQVSQHLTANIDFEAHMGTDGLVMMTPS